MKDRTIAVLERIVAKYPILRSVSKEEFNALPPFRRRCDNNGKLFGKFPTKATHHMDVEEPQ